MDPHISTADELPKTIEECKNNYVNQSGKTSTITRTIIFGLLATIWGISFKDGTFSPSALMWWSLIGYILYLCIDFLQYFCVSVLCYRAYIRIDRGKTTIEKHEAFISRLSLVSLYCYIVKCCCFIGFSAVFICGIIELYPGQ